MDTATPEMGEISLEVGSYNMSAVERKKVFGTKEFQALEIILLYGGTVKKFVQYISFLS